MREAGEIQREQTGCPRGPQPRGRRENGMGWKDSLCSSLHIWCFSELSLSRVGEQLSPGVPWNLEQSDQLKRRCQRHCLSQQNRDTPISFLHLRTQQRCLATLAEDRPPDLEADISHQVNSERSSQEVGWSEGPQGSWALVGGGCCQGWLSSHRVSGQGKLPIVL